MSLILLIKLKFWHTTSKEIFFEQSYRLFSFIKFKFRKKMKTDVPTIMIKLFYYYIFKMNILHFYNE